MKNSKTKLVLDAGFKKLYKKEHGEYPLIGVRWVDIMEDVGSWVDAEIYETAETYPDLYNELGNVHYTVGFLIGFNKNYVFIAPTLGAGSDKVGGTWTFPKQVITHMDVLYNG